MVVRPGPRYSVMDVHRGLVDGLRANGCNVYDFKFDSVMELYSAAHFKRGARWRPGFDEAGALHLAGEHLQSATYRFWPDVIICTSAFWIPAEVWGIWKMRPHHVVAWLTESPYEDDKHIRFAEWADTVAINDPLNLETYRAVNPNTHYFPHSYDPDIHRPGPGRPEWACDVAFSGTGFQSRIDFLDSVDWSGIDLRLAGMWALLDDDHHLASRLVHSKNECMDNVETAVLYRSAKAGFNFYRKEATATADGVAMGPREVEMAATGTFFLRESRLEGDELLPMLPTFDGPVEFSDKLRWWLAHEPQRLDAAQRAREAIAGRTFTNTTARLLRLVESRTPTAA